MRGKVPRLSGDSQTHRNLLNHTLNAMKIFLRSNTSERTVDSSVKMGIQLHNQNMITKPNNDLRTVSITKVD